MKNRLKILICLFFVFSTIVAVILCRIASFYADFTYDKYEQFLADLASRQRFLVLPLKDFQTASSDTGVIISGSPE